jgi:hypothetical protein
MKKYIIVGSGVKWTCEASSEQEAWESLAQIKQLPVKELKKMFTLMNSDPDISKNQ